MNNKFTVLVVEDDPFIADLAEESLVLAGFQVCGIATNLAQSVALARVHMPQLAVVDIRLADGDVGTEVAAALKQMGDIAVLYATGSVEMITANDVGDGYLIKPYTLDSLSKAAAAIVDYVRTGDSQEMPANLVLLHKAERAS